MHSRIKWGHVPRFSKGDASQHFWTWKLGVWTEVSIFSCCFFEIIIARFCDQSNWPILSDYWNLYETVFSYFGHDSKAVKRTSSNFHPAMHLPAAQIWRVPGGVAAIWEQCFRHVSHPDGSARLVAQPGAECKSVAPCHCVLTLEPPPNHKLGVNRVACWTEVLKFSGQERIRWIISLGKNRRLTTRNLKKKKKTYTFHIKKKNILGAHPLTLFTM